MRSVTECSQSMNSPVRRICRSGDADWLSDETGHVTVLGMMEHAQPTQLSDYGFLLEITESWGICHSPGEELADQPLGWHSR